MRTPITVLRSFALAAVLALVGPTAARAAEDTSKVAEGFGEAAILNGDEPTAKKKAEKAALQDALEKTLGTYVASVSESKDFQLVRNNVMSKTEGYVKSFETLESKKDGEVWTVKVKAVIDNKEIDKDMQAKGLLLARLKFPRLAVFITEQGINETSGSTSFGPQGGKKEGGSMYTTDEGVVENKLMEEWLADGFTFVDMEALSGKLKAKNVVNGQPGAGAAKEIGNLSDADVVIYGTAIAKNQGNVNDLLGGGNDKGTGMTSCKGIVSGKVFTTDSGDVLAVVPDANKTALHIDPLVCGHNALLQAAKIFADDLKKRVLKSWNDRVSGGSRIRLQVASGATMKALKEFETCLSETRGVQSVDRKSFSGGKADLDLKVEGGEAGSLAEDLDGKTCGKTKVSITGQTSNTITAELK